MIFAYIYNKNFLEGIVVMEFLVLDSESHSKAYFINYVLSYRTDFMKS